MLETIAGTAHTTETRLGRSVAPRARQHPGQSGIVELRDGRDAFAARVLLADTAERTLDLQYYIWRKDMSGSLLFAAVCRAADRGVRVRLLLDDNNTTGLDGFLGALTSHPNIKVRLFNPFRLRRLRPLEYLTDFARLNRRMHNKSFTVDGQVAIVGGRNIGDEYFDAHQALSFVDLDVMAVGPVGERNRQRLRALLAERVRAPGRVDPRSCARRDGTRSDRGRGKGSASARSCRIHRTRCSRVHSSTTCSWARSSIVGRPRAWSATIRRKASGGSDRAARCSNACSIR